MKRPVLRCWRQSSGAGVLCEVPSHPTSFTTRTSRVGSRPWMRPARQWSRANHFPPAGGYTLIEILVSTTLALMLLVSVVAMFGRVGQSINDSRSMLEAAERLRSAAARLQSDLAGVTVTMVPPRDPANNEGYFEYIEGPVGTTARSPGATSPPGGNVSAMILPTQVVANTDNGNAPDTELGDFDDILMFTTRSSGRPFVGLAVMDGSGIGAPMQSEVAEVAWFVARRNLHRRVLLVAPGLNQNSYFTGTTAGGNATSGASFYANNDISARSRSVNGAAATMVANTLGDLTRRECRFAHSGSYPYNVRAWQWSVTSLPSSSSWTGGTPLFFATLPTLNECTTSGWSTEQSPFGAPALPGGYLDLRSNTMVPLPNPPPGKPVTLVPAYRLDEAALTPAQTGTRTTDDIILTNVIGFDVKAWDPNYVDPATSVKGAYVDLGYNNSPPNNTDWVINTLQHLGAPKSPAAGTRITNPRLYDTFSTHYEVIGAGSTPAPISGFDTNGNGVVNDYGTGGENTTLPPYPMPLRAIQVKIRTFEPDSNQVREMTVEQSFLPQ